VVKANSALHPSMIQGEKKEPQPSEADIRRQSFAEAESEFVCLFRHTHTHTHIY